MTESWRRSSPAAERMDGDVVSGLVTHFSSWREANLHAVIIARNGGIVLEEYFTGLDRSWATPLGEVRFGPDQRHDLRSITKSVTSLLYGIAIADGAAPPVESRLKDVLPAYAHLLDGGKELLTIRHLLTMTAGLSWNEAVPYRDSSNTEQQMIRSADRLRFVFERPLAREPGMTYLYNGGLTAIISHILETHVGMPLEEYATLKLFGPLGITGVTWHRYDDGIANASSGLRLNALDTARLGQLLLDSGRACATQVVPKAWLEEATSPQIQGENLYFYGYYWWLGRSLVAKKEVKWTAAFGYGGQRLYIVPALNLVVLALAGLYDDQLLQSVVGDVVLRRYALPSCLS